MWQKQESVPVFARSPILYYEHNIFNTCNKSEVAMNNLIVFDHPYGIQASENEPHNRSFCAASLDEVHI